VNPTIQSDSPSPRTLEAQRALEALREERLFTDTLLQSLPGIFYLYTYPELRLIRWNRNHEVLLGYSPGEIRNRSLFDWHPPGTRELVAQAVELVMAQGSNMVESPLLAKDGRPVWFLMTGVRVELGERRYLMGVGLDISERRRVEEARAQQAAMLRMAGRLARFGGWSVNLGEPRVLWSDEVSLIHGEKPGFSPTLEEAIQFYAPEWRGRIAKVFEGCARDGVPYDEELEIITAAGSRRWVRTTGEAVRDASGAIVRVQGAFQDISEHKHEAAEQEKLRSQLVQAQKMESVGRLAGGVAHDFNNMLTAILGNVELVLDGLPPGSPLRENVEEIQTCARRSADLTRQLLAFARKQTVCPAVLDLNATVEGMLKMLHRLIGESIELVWMPGGKLWPVRLDPSQIDQVLANLCINARDAMHGGVGQITIETHNVSFDEAYCARHTGAVPGDYVLLSVQDTGCGMDQEVQSHLFEPFFTTKGVGQGVGLGLATVYGIIKQNSGFISVESSPGNGSTFRLYFSRHAAVEKAMPDAAPASPGAGTETILLVEDEPAILRIARLSLENLGYQVLPAASPGEAVRLAEAHAGEIHLLMTDVIMPGMNGRELAQKLSPRFPRLKRLFMSGYTADVIARHGVLAEGVHFLQKPFTVPTLAGKVREALDDRVCRDKALDLSQT
jgi:PAS domain S-box-containing protein